MFSAPPYYKCSVRIRNVVRKKKKEKKKIVAKARFLSLSSSFREATHPASFGVPCAPAEVSRISFSMAEHLAVLVPKTIDKI